MQETRKKRAKMPEKFLHYRNVYVILFKYADCELLL